MKCKFSRSELIEFDRQYGDKSFSDLLKEHESMYPHTCPKCFGVGVIAYQVDTYPSGLPDSGFVERLETRHASCSVCNGVGFTKTQIFAKPIITGYTYS